MDSPHDPTCRTIEATVVRSAILARRMRNGSFPPGLFGEPAWDCLLELYLALIEQRRISVTDLCVAAVVPQTTALRWLNVLQQNELVRRIPDRRDSRRTFVELTHKGEALMNSYFNRVPCLWNGC